MADVNKNVTAIFSVKDESRGTLESITKGTKEAGTSFKSMAAAVAIGAAAFAAAKAAIGSISGYLEDATANALDNERAMGVMRQTIKNVGLDMNTATEAIKAQQEAMVKLGFAGTDAGESMTQFIGITKSVEESQKLAALAADVARGKNIDLASATDMVQRVLLNGAMAARKLGVDVKDSATNVEALNAVLARYGGTADEFATNSAGAAEKSKIAWSELKEAIGGKLLPIINELNEIMYAVATDPRMAQALELIGYVAENYAVPAIQYLSDTVYNFGVQAANIFATFGESLDTTTQDATENMRVMQEVVKILLTTLGVMGLSTVAVFKVTMGVVVGYAKGVAGVAASIWNSILDGVQQGLNFINKAISKAIDAYNVVAGVLGTKKVSYTGSFSIEASKVSAETIASLQEGYSEGVKNSYALFDKDVAGISDFIKAQATSGQSGAKAKEAGSALATKTREGFSSTLTDLMKGTAGGGGDTAKKAMDDQLASMKKLAQGIKDMIDEAKAKTKEWNDLQMNIEDTTLDVSASLKKAGIEVAGVTDRTRTLTKSHKDMVVSLLGDMKSYAAALVDTKGKIGDIQGKIEDLKAESAKALADNIAEANKSAVDAFVGMSPEDQAKAAQANYQWVQQHQAEIAHAQELANMDEVSRTLALAKEKEASLKEEYAAKQSALEDELAAAQAQYDAELAMLQQANADIKDENEKAKGDYAQYLLDTETLTNAHISAEIDKYNQLAAAIRNSAMGQSTNFTTEQNDLLDQYKNGAPKMASGGIVTKPTYALIGESGPEAVVPLSKGGMTGTTINVMAGANVSVTNEADEKRLAKTVAGEIARALQLQRQGLATHI